MQRKIVLTVAFLAVILSLVIVSQYGTQNYPQPPAVTPSSTPTVTETSSPIPTETPIETVTFQAVSVDSAQVISVQVCSHSGQNITITQAAIKDNDGNILATDNALNNTLPASGINTKITLQIDTVNFTSGGPYTLTLTSEQGNDFIAPKIYTISQSYGDSSGN